MTGNSLETSDQPRTDRGIVNRTELLQASMQYLDHLQRLGVRMIRAGERDRARAWLDESFPSAVSSVVDSGSSVVGSPGQASHGQPTRTHPTPPGSDRRSEVTSATTSASNAHSVAARSQAANVPSAGADVTMRSPDASSPRPQLAVSAGSSAAGSSANNAASRAIVVHPGPWPSPKLEWKERVRLLDELQTKCASCSKCSSIVIQRKQAVFGEGNVAPKVVFFGEAPGADEDRLGRPFVGRAGQLLDKIIIASQLRREDTYILNALKCRPPGNRTPVDSEIENCRPFFELQLDILQPDYIVCLGSVAVRAVLQSSSPVGRLRGVFHRYREAKVLVTYHPSYLLRTESAKKQTWEDMQMLMRELGLTPPGKTT